MDVAVVHYKVKAATRGDLRAHLGLCSSHFSPPLAERVDLDDYALKLFERSVTFEAWVGADLLGLVAAYVNAGSERPTHVSSVSVAPTLAGQGVAFELMRRCLAYARDAGARCVMLEVARAALPARSLYRKLGFEPTGEHGDLLTMSLSLG